MHAMRGATVRTCLAAAVVAYALLNWASAQEAPAPSETPELFVSQIGDGAPAPDEPSSDESAEVQERLATLEGVPVFDLSQALVARLPDARNRNASSIVQSGARQTAIVSLVGIGNSTLQLQDGYRNRSEVSVQGALNRVAVDQSGRRLNSEVALGGRGQLSFGRTVIHIQRGSGNPVTSQPFPTQGIDTQPRIVVDTDRGRRVFTVPEGSTTVTPVTDAGRSGARP